MTAEYSLRPEGMIRVLNTCHKGSPEGCVRTAEGKAKIIPDSGNAKLKVSFFGPFFFGDYWSSTMPRITPGRSSASRLESICCSFVATQRQLSRSTRRSFNGQARLVTTLRCLDDPAVVCVKAFNSTFNWCS